MSRSPLEALNAYKRMGREGVDVVDGDELMALSVFVLADGVVYHTYSC